MVFGKEQSVRSHHKRLQLRKHYLHCISGLFEIGDRAIPSSIHYWVDKKVPLQKGNESLSSLYFNWQVFQDSITCDVVDMDACLWDDHESMTLG